MCDCVGRALWSACTDAWVCVRVCVCVCACAKGDTVMLLLVLQVQGQLHSGSVVC